MQNIYSEVSEVNLCFAIVFQNMQFRDDMRKKKNEKDDQIIAHQHSEPE